MYNNEFSQLLGKNIFYKNTVCNKLYKMNNDIICIIENQLWKFPVAKQKMINFVLNTPTIDYCKFNEYYLQLKKEFNIPEKLSLERGDERLNSIKKYVDLNFQVSQYLDIGCFDGLISESIGHHFKLSNDKIHGVDIEEKKTNITFVKYDGVNLPYDDSKFDLITCLMTLHHIPNKNINKLCLEISRVLKTNGILIIREHNILNKNSISILNLLHDFYDLVWTDFPSKSQWCANYRSHIEWTNKLSEFGLLLRTEPIIINNNKNPFFSYYASYIKK